MSDPKMNDGWIEWSGGENPAPGHMVEVRFASGTEASGSSATLDPYWPVTSDSQTWRKIIAYRLVTAAEDRSGETTALRAFVPTAQVQEPATPGNAAEGCAP